MGTYSQIEIIKKLEEKETALFNLFEFGCLFNIKTNVRFIKKLRDWKRKR